MAEKVDVKNMAAMFGAAKKDPPPPREKKAPVGKVAVAGIFGGANKDQAVPIKQEVKTVKEPLVKPDFLQGKGKSEKLPNKDDDKDKITNNPFMKKTTVKLD